MGIIGIEKSEGTPNIIGRIGWSIRFQYWSKITLSKLVILIWIVGKNRTFTYDTAWDKRTEIIETYARWDRYWSLPITNERMW